MAYLDEAPQAWEPGFASQEPAPAEMPRSQLARWAMFQDTVNRVSCLERQVAVLEEARVIVEAEAEFRSSEAMSPPVDVDFRLADALAQLGHRPKSR